MASLDSDPVTATIRTKLAVHSLPPNALAEYLTHLAERGELHADALLSATQELGQSVLYSDEEELERLEEMLSSAPNENLRRLAFAALSANAERHGWTEERLERLQDFRADPSILVAAAAQFTFPGL